VSLVLFDVDGTLVNVRGSGRWALTRAFELTFARPGLGDIVSDVRFDGRTDPAIIAEIASRAGIESETLARRSGDLEECYLSQLRGRLGELGRVEALPGVLRLVHALTGRGICRGLLTGNTRAGAMLKLGAAGLDEIFDEGAFGSDGADRAELGRLARERFSIILGRHLAPSEIVVIGDAPEDVRAARSNGYRSLAVGTGWTSLDALRAESADLVVQDLSDTESILEWIAGSAKSPAGQAVSRG